MCVIGYFIYVLYPHKMSLANPVFALIEYSMVVLAVGSVRYGWLPIIIHTVYIAIVLYKASFIS